MTRRSKRELERILDDREAEEPPEVPPAEWMEQVPEHLWGDPVAAWRAYIEQGDGGGRGDDGGDPAGSTVSADV